jgi:E3 ubiquitin-protein ligase MYCBP2
VFNHILSFSRTHTLQKSKRETEEKHVVREGQNSLITYPNASSYSIFAHVRHLVLQTKLCETYNSRLTYDSSGETDAEEEEESGKKDEAKKMPVVVGLGVKGVFTIVRDIWHTHPELCLRALKEFLNILQGQSPAGLKNEPYESTGNDCVCSMFCQTTISHVAITWYM